MTALDALSPAAGATPGGAPWTSVCRWDDLVPDRGVAALVDGRAVAVFRCSFGRGLYAVDNVDPFTGSSVLSRGLVGVTSGDGSGLVPFVASPLRKQRFSLEDGVALEHPDTAIATWEVRVADGVVEVGALRSTPGTLISGQ